VPACAAGRLPAYWRPLAADRRGRDEDRKTMIAIEEVQARLNQLREGVVEMRGYL
jgi:hypothetical protein